jgi:hypothetical protein
MRGSAKNIFLVIFFRDSKLGIKFIWDDIVLFFGICSRRDPRTVVGVWKQFLFRG